MGYIYIFQKIKFAAYGKFVLQLTTYKFARLQKVSKVVGKVLISSGIQLTAKNLPFFAPHETLVELADGKLTNQSGTRLN